MVADLLSRSVPAPEITEDFSPETDIIQLLHTPLQCVVSLQELKTASEQDPIFSLLCTYIREGWPLHVSEELKPFARIKDELSCWNDTCGTWALHFGPGAPSRECARNGARGAPGNSETQTALPG